jgi:hypothetical protein
MGKRARAARAPGQANDAARETLTVRRVFETWWVPVPDGFAERWIADGNYWHAWDERRSISVSSTVLTDRETGRPVMAEEIARTFATLLRGEPIDDVPPGLRGRATIITTDGDAPAARALTGCLAADGRILIATITSDDLAWARRIWCSIAYRPPAARRR